MLSFLMLSRDSFHTVDLERGDLRLERRSPNLTKDRKSSIKKNLEYIVALQCNIICCGYTWFHKVFSKAFVLSCWRLRLSGMAPKTLIVIITILVRQSVNQKIAPITPPLTWSGWSSCSVSCGGGSRWRRTRFDDRIETQECNFQACPKPQSNTFEKEEKETWLIGGDNTLGSIERLIETSNGTVFSSIITNLPNSYTNHVAGYLDGKVYVCGGNSGIDSTGQYRLHNTCYSVFPSQPTSWIQAPSMITNTTNAAYSVHNGNLHVFGGFQSPACGARPGVQIFSSGGNSWSQSSRNDAPFELGAYQCAVTAGEKIFVIGGWYPWELYPSASTCKETLDDNELIAINREMKYYQNRVQIFDPNNGRWSQGPPLHTKRRKHGCALINMFGRFGIMVVGGTNSGDGSLKSAEYLDLGNNLSNIQFGEWIKLRNMLFNRSTNPVVIDGRYNIVYKVLGVCNNVFFRENVFVVGGESFSNEKSIERFNKRTQRWDTMNYTTKSKRKNFSFVTFTESFK